MTMQWDGLDLLLFWGGRANNETQALLSETLVNSLRSCSCSLGRLPDGLRFAYIPFILSLIGWLFHRLGSRYEFLKNILESKKHLKTCMFFISSNFCLNLYEGRRILESSSFQRDLNGRLWCQASALPLEPHQCLFLNENLSNNLNFRHSTNKWTKSVGCWFEPNYSRSHETL